MKCRVCSANSNEIFTAQILSKHKIRYYLCPDCNFLQTEDPFWLGEAYQSAIGISDTGILKRNNLFASRTSAIISALLNSKEKFLDYAGGYGIFVRIMRDFGFDFYWHDPFAENIFAKGFEYNKNDKIFLVTALECFEHFVNPLSEIEELVSISENIIFSTRLIKVPPPKPSEWWYYSLASGQHISFYSTKTLKYIANKFNLHLNSDGKAFHMLSRKKHSNFVFNSIIKLSDIGLSNLFRLNLKSKSDSDNQLLSEDNTQRSI